MFLQSPVNWMENTQSWRFFTGDFYLTGLNSAVKIAPQEAQLGPAGMALGQGQSPSPFCWRFRSRTPVSASDPQNKMSLKLHSLAERTQLGKAVLVLAIPLTSSRELITSLCPSGIISCTWAWCEPWFEAASLRNRIEKGVNNWSLFIF